MEERIIRDINNLLTHLFQKMKEAEYEWNAEKKEIKKIEDEPKNYKQQVMSEMTDLVKDYIKQKSSWSEEDERICQCLIRDQEEAFDDVCNDKCGHSEIISDLKEMYRERIDWLKSLKNLIQDKIQEDSLNHIFEEKMNDVAKLQQEGGSGLVKAMTIVKYDFGNTNNTFTIRATEGKCVVEILFNIKDMLVNEENIIS